MRRLLHDNGRIHGDLKQRNILRVIDGLVSGGACVTWMHLSSLVVPRGRKLSATVHHLLKRSMVAVGQQ